MCKHGEERRHRVHGNEVSQGTYSLFASGKIVHMPSTALWIEKEKFCAKCKVWEKINNINDSMGAVMCPTCCTPWD